jgi:hypothetical protein
MDMLLILAALLVTGLLILNRIEKRRDDDILPAPRPDRVVNNWKYSGLPPR